MVHELVIVEVCISCHGIKCLICCNIVYYSFEKFIKLMFSIVELSSSRPDFGEDARVFVRCHSKYSCQTT